ncbi:strychnine-11-hydroxylase-like [Henckelia pumila]|uniref:strychnine-11-hydroxylase-like n=1 Tax=Henckelia pumila TaxID=405737 RepID=UPI003C6E2780
MDLNILGEKAMNPEIFLPLFLSFIAPLLLIIFLLKKKRNKKLPPGPKKLPIIGNLHQLGRKLPHRSFQELSKTYGDLMLLHLGSVPTVIVSSADMSREIFKSHDLTFSGRPSFYLGKKSAFVSSCTLTLAPYGEYWRQVRKIAVLELLSAKRVQSFGTIRDGEVDFMIRRVSEHGTSPVNLSSLAFSLSNNVLCRAAFGTLSPDGHGNGDGGMNKFQHMLEEMQQLAAEFNVANVFPWLAWVNKFNGVERKIDKNFMETHEFFDRVIEQHRDPERPKPDQEDIIDVLLRIQDDPDQEFKLQDEHVKGVLGELFSAGTHTSSSTIEWTMAELIRNPQIKEKAQREVRKACKGNVKVEENDLQSLTYLKLVIKESLRLHPPAPLMVPRETTENCTIDNKYEIPAKTRVIFNAAAIGTDPKYWENPEKFYPERFLNRDVDFRGHHFELLPFGAGRRGCPGINFAVSLVELAIANLLFSFDWELPRGMSPRELDMEEAPGIATHKKIPLCLVASPPPTDIH